MRPDPERREDGLCFVCLEPIETKPLKAVYQSQRDRDPFCSSICARAWHGAPLPPPSSPGLRSYTSGRTLAGDR